MVLLFLSSPAAFIGPNSNCEVISDVLEQSHFRADAVGYISLFGNVNVEADAGTAVVVSNGIEVDQSLFDWTYYNHSN